METIQNLLMGGYNFNITILKSDLLDFALEEQQCECESKTS